MRRIHIFSIIVFAIAAAAFGIFQFREKVLADRTGPRITMDNKTITVSVNAGEEELLAGISAVDEKDGDVSGSLLVESLSNFTGENVRTLTFAASDSDGHIVKGTREIVYRDYDAPRFTLQQPLRFPTGVQDILTGVGAEDLLDGDLTAKIKISGEYTLTASAAGEYPMEFTVSNSAGDVVKLPVTVTVYTEAEEWKRPQIELSEYIVYTSVGTKLDPWDYVQKITVGETEFIRQDDGNLWESLTEEGSSGQETEDVSEEEENSREPSPGQASVTEDQVTVEDGVDYQTPGTYEITYQYTDEDDRTGSVRLVVVVCD